MVLTSFFGLLDFSDGGLGGKSAKSKSHTHYELTLGFASSAGLWGL